MSTSKTTNPGLDYSVLVARIDSEIEHINALVDSRLDALKALLTQRADFQDSTIGKSIEILSTKLSESLQEMRGYKDILQQQLILLDGAIKSAHQRLDTLQSEIDQTLASSEALRRQLVELETRITGLETSVATIQNERSDEALVEKTKKESPLRIFFTEQIVKKYASLIIGSLVAYIFLNFKDLLAFIGRTFLNILGD